MVALLSTFEKPRFNERRTMRQSYGHPTKRANSKQYLVRLADDEIDFDTDLVDNDIGMNVARSQAIYTAHAASTVHAAFSAHAASFARAVSTWTNASGLLNTFTHEVSRPIGGNKLVSFSQIDFPVVFLQGIVQANSAVESKLSVFTSANDQKRTSLLNYLRRLKVDTEIEEVSPPDYLIVTLGAILSELDLTARFPEVEVDDDGAVAFYWTKNGQQIGVMFRPSKKIFVTTAPRSVVLPEQEFHFDQIDSVRALLARDEYLDILVG